MDIGKIALVPISTAIPNLEFEIPGIYVIVCNGSSYYYIGQSQLISGRIKNHLQQLNSGKHISSMQLDFNKYGEKTFCAGLVYSLSNSTSRERIKVENKIIIDTRSLGYALYNVVPVERKIDLASHGEITELIELSMNTIMNKDELVNFITRIYLLAGTYTESARYLNSTPATIRRIVKGRDSNVLRVALNIKSDSGIHFNSTRETIHNISLLCNSFGLSKEELLKNMIETCFNKGRVT